jgi:NAD(P)-dependent dehydrogenase (short-subunit alcohol dehydrogenase family)
MDPRDKIAVVTGAAGGIGGALVRALLDAGAATVVATDIRVDGLAGFTDEPKVLTRPLDVADDGATRGLVESIESEVGPIDLWFANAGVAGGGGAEAPDATWDLQWRVNVLAHVYAARALLPGWTARREGHLVTTASMAGILTSLGDGVYAATKHAAVGFAEWLAITYADQGIKVSCICPGAVDTPMLAGGAGGDPGKASAVIGGGEVLSAPEAAARVVQAVSEDRFLILTHPEMQTFIERKATDPQRWINGMARLWGRAQELLKS